MNNVSVILVIKRQLLQCHCRFVWDKHSRYVHNYHHLHLFGRYVLPGWRLCAYVNYLAPVDQVVIKNIQYYSSEICFVCFRNTSVI